MFYYSQYLEVNNSLIISQEYKKNLSKFYYEKFRKKFSFELIIKKVIIV